MAKIPFGRVLFILASASVSLTGCGGADGDVSNDHDGPLDRAPRIMARDELSQLEGPADVDESGAIEEAELPIVREPAENEPPLPLGQSQVAPDKALVRVVHASMSAPRVDFFRTGEPVPMAIDLMYGSASGYVAVQPGTYTFDLRSGEAHQDAVPLVTSDTVTVEGGERWTFVIAGEQEEPKTLRMMPLLESLEEADAGTARIRLVHAGVDAPLLSFDVEDDGDLDVPDLARFDVAHADVAVEAEARARLGVYADDARLTGFTMPRMDGGTEVLAIATGTLSSLPRQESSFSLLLVRPNAPTLFARQDPFVYTLHGSPDVGTVDIYAGEIEVADSVAFGQLTEYQLPPGTYALDVFEARTGTHPRPETDPVATGRVEAFAQGNTYLVAFTPPGPGTADSEIRVQRYVEDFMLGDEGNARVRWVHAAGDLDALDVGATEAFGNAEAPLFVEGLAFAEATAPHGTVVAPGELALGVAAVAEGAAVRAQFPSVSFYEGDRVIGVFTRATGLADLESPLGLLLVDTGSCPPNGAWSVAYFESN